MPIADSWSGTLLDYGSNRFARAMTLVDSTGAEVSFPAGKAEDSAHTSGDTGQVMLAVRTDTAIQRAGTDADYSVLETNSLGRLYVAPVQKVSADASIVLATSTTVGTAVDARQYSDIGLVIPSTFDGTTITFQVSADGVTYQALYDINNNAVGMTVAASRSYDLPGELTQWPYFKVVAGTVQATTDTALVAVLRS